MKKYFIFGDAHGFFNILKKSLNDAGYDYYNKNHIIVSLGDLLDRGAYPNDCLKFVNSLPNERKILIRGNHEDLMEQAIARGEFLMHDIQNGTAQTAYDLCEYGLNSFTEFDVIDKMKKNKEYNDYISSTVDYYEDENNIFVHGWIPCKSDDPNQYHSRNVNYFFDDDWRTGDWKRARWINGMDAWWQGVRVPNKTIYCGHWHTSWGHSKIHKVGKEWDNPCYTNPEYRLAHFEPFVDDGICAADACVAYSHKINVVTIEQEIQ